MWGFFAIFPFICRVNTSCYVHESFLAPRYLFDCIAIFDISLRIRFCVMLVFELIRQMLVFSTFWHWARPRSLRRTHLSLFRYRFGSNAGGSRTFFSSRPLVILFWYSSDLGFLARRYKLLRVVKSLLNSFLSIPCLVRSNIILIKLNIILLKLGV